MTTRKPDFTLTSGSICLLTPRTQAARRWVAEHIPPKGLDSQRWAGAVVIEPRYAEDIVAGAREAGLVVA